MFGHGQLYVAVSRVGAPERCTIAMKQTEDQPAHQTRNVVYQEVLEAAVANPRAQPEVVPQGAATSVPDLSEWTNYEAVCDESDNELDLEEAGQPEVGHVRRQVKRSRPVRLSRSPARQAMAPLPTVPRPMDPWPQGPLSEYELIREANIAEREAEYQRIYGEPLSRSHGQFGWLGESNDS